MIFHLLKSLFGRRQLTEEEAIKIKHKLIEIIQGLEMLSTSAVVCADPIHFEKAPPPPNFFKAMDLLLGRLFFFELLAVKQTALRPWFFAIFVFGYCKSFFEKTGTDIKPEAILQNKEILEKVRKNSKDDVKNLIAEAIAAEWPDIPPSIIEATNNYFYGIHSFRSETFMNTVLDPIKTVYVTTVYDPVFNYSSDEYNSAVVNAIIGNNQIYNEIKEYLIVQT